MAIALEVELLGRGAQDIARGLGLDHFRTELLSQLGNEVLKRRDRRPRRLLPPEGVQEPVLRDNAVRVEQKKREHGALFLTAKQELARLVRDLERP